MGCIELLATDCIGIYGEWKRRWNLLHHLGFSVECSGFWNWHVGGLRLRLEFFGVQALEFGFQEEGLRGRRPLKSAIGNTQALGFRHNGESNVM